MAGNGLSRQNKVKAYATLSAFPTTGSQGVIYIDKSTGILYTWNGSAYVSSVATSDEWNEIMHNGETFTVLDEENLSATINQNDVTNNPAALIITNTGSGNDVTLPNSSSIKNGVATFTSEFLTSTAPIQTMLNTTAEDTDGGRESKLLFKGRQSGAEETTLASIEVSHEGTGDDELGQIKFKVNDGNDGNLLSEEVRISGDGKLHILAGDIGLGATDKFTIENLSGFYTDIRQNIYYNVGWKSASGGTGSYIRMDGGTSNDSALQFLTSPSSTGTAKDASLTMNLGMELDKDSMFTTYGGRRVAMEDAGAVDYNPSALTSDYKIVTNNTAAARNVIISTEDIASGTPTNPREFLVSDYYGQAGTNTITVSGETGTINGAANAPITVNYNSMTIHSDGTNLTIV